MRSGSSAPLVLTAALALALGASLAIDLALTTPAAAGGTRLTRFRPARQDRGRQRRFPRPFRFPSSPRLQRRPASRR